MKKYLPKPKNFPRCEIVIFIFLGKYRYKCRGLRSFFFKKVHEGYNKKEINLETIYIYIYIDIGEYIVYI